MINARHFNYCLALESNADSTKEQANNPDIESELYELFVKIQVQPERKESYCLKQVTLNFTCYNNRTT